MAHFRGTLIGNRGEASRLGTKNSGIETECNGWEGGVKVQGDSVTLKDGTEIDHFDIYATKGSSYRSGQGCIGFVHDGYFFLKYPGRVMPQFKGHKSHNERGCPRCSRDIRTLDKVNNLCRRCFTELTV